MGPNQHIFVIPTSISAHWHYGVSNYFNVNRLEYLGGDPRGPKSTWAEVDGPRSTDPGGRHALVRAGESWKADADACYVSYPFKIMKIHLILTLKQCVCNSVNLFLDHKQNKAKLSCTSHLFSWNCVFDLAIICDPDSTVRWVYTPEIGSALHGELNRVFGN